MNGGVQLNYTIKLFDRERFIDMTNEADAARSTTYFNKENARYQLARPGGSPYVYNSQTLGLRLDKGEEIGLYRYDELLAGKPVKSFTDYARCLIDALMNAQESTHLCSDDWQRTVYIKALDVGTVDFDLPDDKKQALIEEGISGTERYFDWFEDPGEMTVNLIEKS